MSGSAIAGTRRAYALLFSYVIAASDGMGSDRALGLLNDIVKKRGKSDGLELVRECHIKGNGIPECLTVYTKLMDDYGAHPLIFSKAEGNALIRVDRCPFYEAFHASEISCAWLTENICKIITLPMITEIIKQVNPNASVSIEKYRTSTTDFCIEKITLG